MCQEQTQQNRSSGNNSKQQGIAFYRQGKNLSTILPVMLKLRQFEYLSIIIFNIIYLDGQFMFIRFWCFVLSANCKVATKAFSEHPPIARPGPS